MAEAETKVPVKESKEAFPGPNLFEWHPLETLRRQIDRLFEDAPLRKTTPDFEPFGRFSLAWASTPAVDLVEKDKEYQITAELPGLDEKNIEVKLSNGTLTISGEKKEEREEKDKGYHLSERRYGSFRRAFRVPEGVNADNIEASFAKGVLTVRLPKTAEGQKPEKTIAIKTA